MNRCLLRPQRRRYRVRPVGRRLTGIPFVDSRSIEPGVAMSMRPLTMGQGESGTIVGWQCHAECVNAIVKLDGGDVIELEEEDLEDG